MNQIYEIVGGYIWNFNTLNKLKNSLWKKLKILASPISRKIVYSKSYKHFDATK